MKIFLIVVIATLSMSSIKADQNLDLFFYESSGKEITDSTQLLTGESKQLVIKAAGNQEVKSISGVLEINLDKISLANIEQKFEFCEFWDEPLKFKQSKIEFLCGRPGNLTDNYLGELFSLEIFTNQSVENVELELNNISYVNASGEQVNLTESEKIIINEKSQVLGAQTDSGSNNVNAILIFAINFILVMSIFITGYLSLRYYKLSAKPAEPAEPID